VLVATARTMPNASASTTPAISERVHQRRPAALRANQRPAMSHVPDLEAQGEGLARFLQANPEARLHFIGAGPDLIRTLPESAWDQYQMTPWKESITGRGGYYETPRRERPRDDRAPADR